ncbi:MAG: L-serine ammonia-lyase [Verrucomicrobiae bacterium]|nr:L-serine ammonia-lyase [Verrucomicrobiae bacterium]MDW8344607.1 L-serine ammonia-lyase [Verrucomicrobiae bacterium]
MSEPVSTSVFDIFKIGIGPSSSHTMGPMRAAQLFCAALGNRADVTRIVVRLHGSLGATGRGHATDRALQRVLPAQCFDPERDIEWLPDTPDLPHPNTLDLVALNHAGSVVLHHRYLSVGGGLIEQVLPNGQRVRDSQAPPARIIHRVSSAAEILALCAERNLTWWQIQLDNESLVPDEVFRKLDTIWQTMRECIQRGLTTEGTLPGPLGVRRRAPETYRLLQQPDVRLPLRDPLELRVHAYALAVNEENAAGGVVVTAPTNGAAGVIPAAFAATQDVHGFSSEQIHRGLLTAALIAGLIKSHASLSGAEMGCQGEVGSAAAMAAGGLVEMFGGTPQQVEMAAEIALEHHLGMTCDPVGGLVQIPCIERNVMGAIKAVHAATLALGSDGQHRISLDQAIEAMRQIGRDMHTRYKETARGGLAKVVQDGSRVRC